MTVMPSINQIPRDYETLCALQISQQFRLANLMGLVVTEEAKKAFLDWSKEQRAQFILEGLNAFDKKGGSTSMAGLPTQQQIPMMMPPIPTSRPAFKMPSTI